MEFLIGGLSACGAVLVTNPLEVAKTRIQLQGELQARGCYPVHYRNVFHAIITIGEFPRSANAVFSVFQPEIRFLG